MIQEPRPQLAMENVRMTGGWKAGKSTIKREKITHILLLLLSLSLCMCVCVSNNTLESIVLP